MTDATPRNPRSIDEVVEAYESAHRRDGVADLKGFLPRRDDPDYLAILCELVRVELEYGWERGTPKRLSYYRANFPELFLDEEKVEEIAYEEFRLRKQAGEHPTADEYRREFGTRGIDWPESLIPGPAPGRDSQRIDPAYISSVHLEAHFGLDRAATAYRRLKPGKTSRFDLEKALKTEGIPAEPARFFGELHETNPALADRLSRGVTTMPSVGGDFLGFHLREELGRGAFGRVYLANQGELADRPVALKISADVADESRALAQLRHTNVVPIHSIHRSGSLQAVCMPYLGSTTLADILKDIKRQDALPDSGEGLLSTWRSRKSTGGGGESRPKVQAQPTPEPASFPFERAAIQIQRLKGLGYVEAVLWIGSRLADGLAHAHDRGILHRDLKPANILFADDGEPLLLDFNLAADTKLRGYASAALVGGTLPYMAPEQLLAFQGRDGNTDARGDVYSLGVILHELLTGRLPYPVHSGAVDDILPAMIEERARPIAPMRRHNPKITPAVESIIRRCLDPEPDHRYRDARELREDLERQLDNRPLKYAADPSPRERLLKWKRRHPKLGSTTTTALVASVVLAATVWGFSVRQANLRRLEAQSALNALGEKLETAAGLLAGGDADPARLDEGINLCRSVAAVHGLPDRPDWDKSPLVTTLSESDRAKLKQDLGGILYLWANASLKRMETSPESERAALLKSAERLNDLARPLVGRGVWTRQRAEIERLAGHAPEAAALKTEAASLGKLQPRELLLVDADKADRDTLKQLWSFVWKESRENAQNPSAWLRLGNLYAKLGLRTKQRAYLDEAEHCYGVAIDLRPDSYWSHFNRGLLRLDTGNPKGAVEDFDRVLELRPDVVSALINRAVARIALKDGAGAAADLSKAIDSKQAPTRAWFLRSKARGMAGDSAGAARDREEGLKRTPSDELSFITRGLARLPRDPQGAIADFDAALKLNPRSTTALQNKASVLSEYLQKTEPAVKVLDQALVFEPERLDSLAGRAVLLARLGRRGEAIEDAKTAERIDDAAATLYQLAGVYALTSRVAADDEKEALRLLASALTKDPTWLNMIKKDPDLAPIRDHAEFRKLIDAVSVVASRQHTGTPVSTP